MTASPRTTLERVVLAAATVLVAALVVQEIPRVLFPWDVRFFTEGVLLTDMMKLTAGQSVYGPPADANSFLYAPGLDYLTYAVLRPFGAQLDIGACRAVCVAIGAVSAAVAGALVARFAEVLGEGAVRRRRALHVAGALVAALVIFRNFTADACHPDNLYGLHAVVLLALTSAAARDARFRLALAAVALGGFGVLVKQTAILGVAGATVVLLAMCARRWGLLRSALLVACAAAASALAAWVVFHGDGRYWALDLPSHQSVEDFRAPRLVAELVATPHRLVLFLAFFPATLAIAMRADDAQKKLLWAWGAIGVTEVLPSLASYLKVLGAWNNLVILDLWASFPVVAACLHVVLAPRDAHPVATRAKAGGALLALLVALVPTRSIPTPKQRAFCRALDEAVARDVAAGKHVLVNVGSSALVHAGVHEPPKDRAVSLGERAVAGERDFAATKERLRAHAYDRIYLFGPESPPYPADVRAVLAESYHVVGRIEGDEMQQVDEDRLGIQGLVRSGAEVLEPSP